MTKLNLSKSFYINIHKKDEKSKKNQGQYETHTTVNRPRFFLKKIIIE